MLVAPALQDGMLGVNPRDPMVYGLVVAVLLTVMIAAGIAPVRQGLSVDPVSVMK